MYTEQRERSRITQQTFTAPLTMDRSSPELYVPADDCPHRQTDPPVHGAVSCSGWRISLEKISKRCDDAAPVAPAGSRWHVSKPNKDVERVLVTFINSVDELCDAEKVSREDSAILQAALDMIKRTEVVKSILAQISE